MVSINSKQELIELKHMLRSLFIENVHDGDIVFFADHVDPNYFVHIGNGNHDLFRNKQKFSYQVSTKLFNQFSNEL